MYRPPSTPCANVQHHTRNGVQALMGLMIELRAIHNRFGLHHPDLAEVVLKINSQIERIGKATRDCKL